MGVEERCTGNCETCGEEEFIKMIHDHFGELPIGNISIKELPIPEGLKKMIGRATVLSIPMPKGLGDLLQKTTDTDRMYEDIEDSKDFGEILTTLNVEVVGYAPDEVAVMYIKESNSSYFQIDCKSGIRTGSKKITSPLLLKEEDVKDCVSTHVEHGLLKIHIHEKKERESADTFSVKIR